MDDVLDRAMEPVLRDLRSTGISTPRMEYSNWTGDPALPSAMMWSPGGSGMGIRVDRHAPDFERIAMAADQVQEWAIEELWGHGRTNWPQCPHHPDSHPLNVASRDRVAVWVCPTDNTVFAPVGSL